MESKITFLFTFLFKSNLIYLETFNDSESISRKNLAQAILAKERETELKKEYEVKFIFSQYIKNKLLLLNRLFK
jgi:hypothetical protein